MDWLEKMNIEQRKSGFWPEQVKETRRRRLETEVKQTAKTKPLTNLTPRQRMLLAKTEPLSHLLM